MYGLACPPAAREGLALSGRRRALSLVGEKRGWHGTSVPRTPPTHDLAVRENGGRRGARRV
jgi:hypothetical protein